MATRNAVQLVDLIEHDVVTLAGHLDRRLGLPGALSRLFRPASSIGRLIYMVLIPVNDDAPRDDLVGQSCRRAFL